MEKRVIESAPGKTFLYLCGCLIFSIGSFSILQDYHGNGAWKLWLGVILFGSGSVVFAVLLIRPHRLILDPAGFSLEGGLILTPKTILWKDVDGFYVWRLPRGGKMIGYRYKPGARNVAKIVGLNRAFGADGALPRAWPIGPEDLVLELNAYRDLALAGRGTRRVFS